MINYIKELQEKGYINKKGTPLKCRFCNYKKFEIINEIYDNHMLIEYSFECKNCKKVNVHCAYGYCNIV